MTTHLGLQRILLPSAQVSQLTTGSITLPSRGLLAVPDAPTIGTATAGSGSASVTFTAAATGTTASSFIATSSPGGVTGTSATSPISISGLTNGTAYTFTVAGVGVTGTGGSSAASNSVTPTSNPGYDFIAQASGAMSTVSFTSLPTGYSSFRILFNSYIGGESIGYIQLNGDSTNGRYSEYSLGWAWANSIQNYGSSSSSQQQRRYAAANDTTNTAQVSIDISNPDQAQEHQIWMYSVYGNVGNTGGWTWSNGNYNNPVAITSITLGGGNGPTPNGTWGSSIITLYGRKRGTAL